MDVYEQDKQDVKLEAPSTFEELIKVLDDPDYTKITAITENILGKDKTMQLQWDYNSEFSKDIIVETLRNLNKSERATAEDVEMALIVAASDQIRGDDYYYDEQCFLEEFCKALEREGISTEKLELSDVMFELEDNGIVIKDDNIEELLSKSQFHIDLWLATPQEHDSIYQMDTILRDSEDVDLDPDTVEQTFDNALSWLICEQKKSINDLCSMSKSPFLESVQTELDENTHPCAYLKILLSVNWRELAEIYANDGKTLKIPDDAVIGLHDHVSGAGSVLGIQAENPVIIPKELIYEIEFEDVKPELTYGATIDTTYGLTSDAWKKGVEVGVEPTLSINEFKNMIDGQSIINAINERREINEAEKELTI